MEDGAQGKLASDSVQDSSAAGRCSSGRCGCRGTLGLALGTSGVVPAAILEVNQGSNILIVDRIHGNILGGGTGNLMSDGSGCWGWSLEYAGGKLNLWSGPEVACSSLHHVAVGQWHETVVWSSVGGVDLAWLWHTGSDYWLDSRLEWWRECVS